MGYLLQQRLGRGGMGVVDLAVDAHGRAVALKRLALHGSIHEMELARQRVRREAEALSRLRHPGIVELLDVVDDGDDVVLVMPYLAGGTLADQVRTYGPLSRNQVLHLADQLLDALAAAHRQGIVHRDIKPANVLFDLDGRAHVTDFGIASFRDATSGLTATGTVVGTPEFMAPEQARGERATTASDVFALGATLLYAATGLRPYGTGDPRVLLHRAAEGRVVRLPDDLDAEVARLVRPLLRKAPDKRPSAARARGGHRGTRPSPTPGPVRPARRGGRRRRTTLAVALAAAVGAATAVLAAALVVRGTTPESSAAAGSAPAPTEAPAPTTVPCTPLPFQPCGGPPAPFTDGVQCTDDHADYDGDAANGCEAAPDAVDGTRLERPITANLVPAADVDRYPFHVDDAFQLFCDGQVDVTLTAPAGTAMRVDVLRDGRPLGAAVSSDGKAATVVLREDGCGTDDSGELQARVSWSGSARTAAPYRLQASGSF
ncbi:MAG: serine/threonine-protein kinase [Acidimicrobiales bacterium]